MHSYDVVIVNYNGESIISSCLESIYNSSVKPRSVIIYDNCSSDNSVNIIKGKFPQVELISGKKNLGFASGNNLAMAKSKAENILFMNNDVILQKDCAKHLLKFLSTTRAAVVNPLIYKGWDKNKVQEVYSFGARMDASAFGYSLYDLGKNRTDLSCFSGACFMARAQIIKKLKFESTFFLYYEEPELSAKLLSNGYSIGRVKEAICYHLESHSSPQEERLGICFRQYFALQNRWFILGKYFKGKHLVLALPLNLIHLFYNFFFFLKCGQFSKLNILFLVFLSFLRGRKERYVPKQKWIDKLEVTKFNSLLQLRKKVYKST